jgi:hypothetical protein
MILAADLTKVAGQTRTRLALIPADRDEQWVAKQW